MEYKPLGKTGLSVSVAGLGCGGNSRLGLSRGASVEECVAVVRTAVDLGVNFLDTAEAYGTEEIVGAAARSYDRDRLVISTKAIFGAADTGDTVARKVEAALRRLRLDHVDIFHFHAVAPAAYEHHRDVLAPALVKLKEQGKVRHVGITETSPNDPEQKSLARAIEEDPWEVIMLAYSLMNQGARRRIFPTTARRGIGTLLMFVVRNIFSNCRLSGRHLRRAGRAGSSRPLDPGRRRSARLPGCRRRGAKHHGRRVPLRTPRAGRRCRAVRHRRQGACRGQRRLDPPSAPATRDRRTASHRVRPSDRRRARPARPSQEGGISNR